MSLDRAELFRRLGAGVGAGTLAGLVAVAEGLAAPSRGNGPSFAPHPEWRLVFLSHLTTSPLFVPLQYGIQDACELVKCSYRWAGSARGDTAELAAAVDAAVDEKADGIAFPLVDGARLAGPVGRALAAGIPLVTYQAKGPAVAGRRLPFVGPDAYAAGARAGRRIAKLVGTGKVAVFVGPSGPGPPRARLAGALTAIRKAAASIEATPVPTSHSPYDTTAAIERHVAENKSLRGLLALDVLATEGVSRAMEKHALRAKGIRAGGYGVLPATLELIDEGELDFTLDEQPYLQGFLAALQLFLAKISGGLVAPSDARVPVRFVTGETVEPYLAKTRFEGSSSRHRYPLA